MAEAIDRLPDDVRRRLHTFAHALERIKLENLPLYAVKPIEPGHGEALNRAEAAAEERGLRGAVDEARTMMTGFVDRQFADAMYRPTLVGLNWGIGLGTTEDRVRVARTLSEAVTALVLWGALAEGDRLLLLGPWAHLID